MLKKLLSNNTIYVFLAAIPIAMLMTPALEIPKSGVDDKVKPYVQRFDEWGKRLKGPQYEVPEMNISVGPINDFNIGLITPTAIGICLFFTKPRTIIISEDFWETASDVEKEMVVFHELGHCALSRMHKHAKGPWGHPMSLMYPSIFSSYTYRSSRGYYIDELFNPY